MNTCGAFFKVPMIKVQELSKKFNDVYAVKELSFEIEKGKVVGLLGPNGAGKTTTMRLMTGYLLPDSGEVTIDTVSVITHPQEAQKQIGYMPEANPLYGDMLVSEALDFSADLKNIPISKRRDAFDFVVNAVHLDDVFYKPIKELSKGYKQRTGLAMAILHRPNVLILDEPTEGLDPNQRTDIRTLIRDLAKERTVIMSTHVMQEAQAVCDYLYIISKGTLVAQGTTKELSQSTDKKQVFDVEIEGQKIEQLLKKIAGLEKVTVVKKQGDKIEATVVMQTGTAFPPALSKLAGSNGWTIWKCAEREEKLEDVFYKLTNVA
jgi:ABC-2 type transport system ATP-binding protein